MHNKFRFNNFKRGFILIELLVVIVVIGALSAGVISVINPPGNIAKTHDAQRKNDLVQIRTALDTYYSDYNKYPAANEYPAKLTDKSTGQVYISKLPKDPLSPKQDYCYEVTSDNNSFRISAKLERADDPQAIHSPDPLITCNGQTIYNYSLTSTNTSTIAFGITPTPAPIIPTSTPMPPIITPTPIVTPTPIPTPTPAPIWTRKADFPGGERYGAIGFSIGNNGYVGTGYNASAKDPLNNFYKDFYEYNPSADTWTKKANIPGGERTLAVGFSIGSKGYAGLGTGKNNIFHKDFYEYDPATNTWTRKADFPGGGAYGRDGAVGFSINGKGYVGLGHYYYGVNFVVVATDFYEYDPATNTWTRKADFPGETRQRVIGFSIGNKGYVGLGHYVNYAYGDVDSGPTYKDFYEYDPATNTWTRKADFPGGERMSTVGFSIGSKGYVGLGDSKNGIYKDLYEYNPVTNAWAQKADFKGVRRTNSILGFSIDNKGYIGLGTNSLKRSLPDFWEYDPLGTPLSVPASGSNVNLTIKYDPPAGAKSDSTPAGTSQHSVGSSQTLKAVAANGYIFDYWTIDDIDTERLTDPTRPLADASDVSQPTVVMNRDKVAVGHFLSLSSPPPGMFFLTTTYNPPEAIIDNPVYLGIIPIGPYLYSAGAQVTVVGYWNNSNFTFSRLAINGIDQVDRLNRPVSSVTVTMNENKTAIAYFVPKPTAIPTSTPSNLSPDTLLIASGPAQLATGETGVYQVSFNPTQIVMAAGLDSSQGSIQIDCIQSTWTGTERCAGALQGTNITNQSKVFNFSYKMINKENINITFIINQSYPEPCEIEPGIFASCEVLNTITSKTITVTNSGDLPDDMIEYIGPRSAPVDSVVSFTLKGNYSQISAAGISGLPYLAPSPVAGTYIWSLGARTAIMPNRSATLAVSAMWPACLANLGCFWSGGGLPTKVPITVTW